MTSQGTTLEDALDKRFGRARYVLVADTETGEVTVHDNTVNLNAAQGAGIQTAQRVSETGAEALITPNLGPKAFRTLSAAGIRVYLAAGCTGREAMERLQRGELAEPSSANVEGHWSQGC